MDTDTWYLSSFRDEVIVQMDDVLAELSELRAAIEANGGLWLDVLADAPDPDRQIEHRRRDTRYVAPVGVRLAQVVQHGTDHRSQVCTALTLLGVEPPDIAVWAYGDATGRDYEQKIEGAPIQTAP